MVVLIHPVAQRFVTSSSTCSSNSGSTCSSSSSSSSSSNSHGSSIGSDHTHGNVEGFYLMSLLDLRSAIKAHTAELKQLKKQRAATTTGSAVSNAENSKAAPMTTVEELDSKIASKKVVLKKMKVHQDHFQLNGGKTADAAPTAAISAAASAASVASAAGASATSTINNASTASTSNVVTAVAAAGPGELLLYVYGDAVLTKCGAT